MSRVEFALIVIVMLIVLFTNSAILVDVPIWVRLPFSMAYGGLCGWALPKMIRSIKVRE